jgi:uncharacterized protein
MIEPTADGVELAVRVIPRAKKSAIGGERDGALVVRIAAPPVEGAANDALVELLSAALRVPRRAIRIISGERGRHKRVAIEGITIDAIRALTHDV